MTGCCGPSICDLPKDEFLCQARKLLPDFGGALDPEGDFMTIFDIVSECIYDEIIEGGCELAKELNPCSSDLYFDRWVQEYGLPVRCPLPDGIDSALETELTRLQVCLQYQLQGGGAFNSDILTQIADALGITYNVTVPTRFLDGVPVCDIIMMPSGKQFCNPTGCSYQQAYVVNVTQAPTDGHVDVFRCFVGEYTPCHAAHCVVDAR